MRFIPSGAKDKVLIYRDRGGLGDIFMHRMLFNDLKPNHLTFACPKQYHEAVSDHPYIDQLIDHHEVDQKDYGVIHNTSWACNRYEMKAAPYITKHRSDIWAEQCGVTLSSHEMHFQLTEEEKTWAKSQLPPKSIALAPVSAMQGKNLDEEQIEAVKHALKDYNVFLLHTKPLANLPFIPTTIRQMMALIHEATAVISVDTAAFHCAGGMHKPLLGIFSFVDGLVYGKYYDMVLLQKHRDIDPDWTCGPCFNYFTCCKLPDKKQLRKPCITQLTCEEIVESIGKLRQKFNI